MTQIYHQCEWLIPYLMTNYKNHPTYDYYVHKSVVAEIEIPTRFRTNGNCHTVINSIIRENLK